VKIKWLGHSCFVITSGENTKLVTDPFKSDKSLTYPVIRESADVVTVSHEHLDHSNIAAVKGGPEVLKGKVDTIIKDISIKSINVWHDASSGRERGANNIFCINMDGINICHLGDLGHRLSSEEIRQIGKVDVLFIPVGGLFTIDAEEASTVYVDIMPGIAIPMHYKTERCQWLSFSADDFIKGRKNVRKINSSEIELNAANLPAENEIVVLKYPV